MAFTEAEMAMTREQRIESVADVAGIVASMTSKGLGQEKMEDNLSFAYFGIIKAVDLYNPTKETSLRNFAFEKARFAVQDGWRANSIIPRYTWTLLKKAEQGQGPAPLVCFTETLDADVVDRVTADPNEKPTEDQAMDNLGVQHAEDVQACNKALEGIKPHLAKVLHLRFFEGATLKDIGRAMGYSESRACQVVKQALKEAQVAIAA